MDGHSPLSIYIHIPFCVHRCSYCAFNVYTDQEALFPDYVDALCRELVYVADSNKPIHVHSVYIGGGTPSLLRTNCYAVVMRFLRRHFELATDAEISMEANPNDLSTEYLSAICELGVNRLSIGMQSSVGRILRMFERQHDLEEVAKAVECAREAGFDNINLDVIFGSPGETLREWEATVTALLGFAPEHISMYGLELKGGTDLRRRVDAGTLPRPDDDLFADMYEFASEQLREAGYWQYEISNWRRPGRECRHSLQYWRNLQYLGIGAGAHGFAGGYRYSNIAPPARYIDALKQGPSHEMPFPLSPAVAKKTLVSRADDLAETVMMGMRMTSEGINRSAFRRRFGQDFVEAFSDGIAKCESLGLLHVESERVRLSDKGRLLSNAVIRELI